MATNNFQLDDSAPIAGLGTFSHTLTATAYYELGISCTIPHENPDARDIVANPPVAQVVTFEMSNDDSGQTAGTYLTFSNARAVNKYYIWYTVGGSGTNPLLQGYTAIQVDIVSDDSDDAIGIATATALSAANLSGITVSQPGGTNTITLTNTTKGAAITPLVVSAEAFGVSIVTAGSSGPSSALKIEAFIGTTQTAFFTLSNPTPSQPSLSGSVRFQGTAGNVINLVISSPAKADNVPNAVQSVVNFFKKF